MQEVKGGTSAALPGSQLRRPGCVEYIVIRFHTLKAEFFSTGN
jgi:hypothetical protein